MRPISLLFVDDEPLVLRGIERGLRSKRPAWEMRFVTSGDAALAVLDHEDFDVIVSDIGMPGMDGVTLLHKVRKHAPHIARLALSGEARFTDRMRAVLEIHQWLAKPCVTSKLISAIDEVLWGRSLVDDPVVSATLTGLANLPSTLTTYRSVARAIERGAGFDELIMLVETDIGIASKLLQLVNSAFFTEEERVVSVRAAARTLGIDRLRSLLISMEVEFSPEAAMIGKRAQFVAALARSFAADHADDVFLAGLLHDVGHLGLGQLHRTSTDPNLYGKFGALLLATWGLPREITDVVAFHVEPTAAPVPSEPRLRAVALAVALVAELDDPRTHRGRVEARAAALGLFADECRRRAQAMRPADYEPAIAPPLPSRTVTPNSR